MKNQINVAERAIEEVSAIAFAMRQMSEMIECSQSPHESQIIATGLVAMAEKVMHKSQLALKNMQVEAS